MFYNYQNVSYDHSPTPTLFNMSAILFFGGHLENGRIRSGQESFWNLHYLENIWCKFQLLQQGYRYHKLRKTFSKFYRRHYELISKYNVGLKTLLSEGLSEPEFYGDLVYKFKKLKGINDFSFQFRKIITRYKRIGYNLNVMRQSACLVFNPIMVDNYAAFFNCTPVGRASDSMMAPT